MPQGFLDAHQVGAGFIKMKTESMAAAVEDKAAAGKAGVHNSHIENDAYGLCVDVGIRALTGKEKIIF